MSRWDKFAKIPLKLRQNVSVIALAVNFEGQWALARFLKRNEVMPNGDRYETESSDKPVYDTRTQNHRL